MLFPRNSLVYFFLTASRNIIHTKAIIRNSESRYYDGRIFIPNVAVRLTQSLIIEAHCVIHKEIIQIRVPTYKGFTRV